MARMVFPERLRQFQRCVFRVITEAMRVALAPLRHSTWKVGPSLEVGPAPPCAPEAGASANQSFV